MPTTYELNAAVVERGRGSAVAAAGESKSPSTRGPLPSTFTILIPERNNTEEPVRSKSIPILRMKRTSSELQLYQDEAEAEARDYDMFLKVYDHLQKQRENTKDEQKLRENAICMDKLLQSRSQHMRYYQKQQQWSTRFSSSPHGVVEEEEEDSQEYGEIFDLDL